MTQTLQQLARLSPEKRRLLELLLKEQGVDLSRVTILPQGRTSDCFPLSFAQQRMWFLNQLQPDSANYNIPSALRLTGKLDVAALERSLNEVVRRHEVLRTTFVNIDGQPQQVIAPTLTLCVPIESMESFPPSEREAVALRLAYEEAQRPFDLARGPLLRMRLLRLGAEDHVAMLTLHHIIADGWSMGVLVHEVATLYQAFATGQPWPLSALPIQYADFAVWQHQWLQGDVLQEQLDYWKHQLAGCPSRLELPTDRPRPPVQTTRGAEHTFDLPPGLSLALKRLSQQEGVTLFMTLLAAFQTLLGRYTGQSDICVGTPIANRDRAELDPLIGFFANTLVLRTDLSDGPSFRALLKRVRDTAVNAYAHQDVPFELLVEELRPERDMSYSPLFQVMFFFQPTSKVTYRLPHLTISEIPAHSGTAKFDLTLGVIDDGEKLGGLVEYNTDLFDAATIQRMTVHFLTLLEGIIIDPDGSVHTLPLLTKTEQHQLLVTWNNTAANYPRDICLHQPFEAQAGRTPDAVAVIFEDQSLTYRELNQRANQLAHYLRKRGVGPEVLVGLYMERSPEMVVAILGVLKAGGAYLPLDLTYPAERLAFMLQDSHAPVLLTQSRLLNDLQMCKVTPICLDADWTTIGQESDADPMSTTTPENVAYVIYTSGSTGTPKGVMISHRAICNHMFWMQETFPLTAADRVLQKTPLSFDASVWEFYAPLWSGAQLVLARQDGHRDSAYLVKTITASRVTILQLVPTLLHLLLDEPGFGTCRTLRRVYCGGEALTVDLQERLFVALPVELHNLYGPTEASIDATFWTCKPGDHRAVVPIGRPIANTQVYVLDHNMQPVPVGVPGELYIGGAGLARGYLYRPDLTTGRFIPDPFCQESGARLYKTGDLVRYLPDGNLEFLGRMDGQVKVRGFRIELGEIETVLGQHQTVRRAAVLAREFAPNDRRLVAYVVPAEPNRASLAGEWRAFLKSRLPDYMLPSAFVTLNELPLTPNGKVDRRALPAPELHTQTDQTCVAPCTPTEELLEGIWAQVLHLEHAGTGCSIGMQDNFFDLGGHSLLATQVLSRVRETFQVELPLRTLFEAPTIAAFSEKVEAARQMAQGLPAPPVRPIPRAGALPLSFAQQRLWFLDQLEPGSPLYNIPVALRLAGPLDANALERCLNEIVRRHEVLRTVFPMVDGQPVQSIQPSLAMVLSVTDLSNLTAMEREAEVLRLATREALQPFDLAHGPLIRTHLLRIGAQDHVVLWTTHHIVSDGWSGGVLMREVAALYAAFCAGQPSPLPELPVQYADFAQWQRQWLQGDVLQAQLAYWKQQLSGSPPLLELPTDRPRPATQTSIGAHHTFDLSPSLARALKALSQREGVTLFMTLLAAFQVLLSRYSHQDDICVGTPIANRDRAEIEDLIGFFVNTLVLRTDLSGNPSFRELLAQVREVTLGAYAHQDVPFEMLVDLLQPERNLNLTPLFQVMFVLQNTPVQILQLPNTTLSHIEVENGQATYDLTLTMVEDAGNIQGIFEYNTDLFDAATISRMAQHMQILLEGIVANPDEQTSALPFMTESERRQSLAEWNDTTAECPVDQCLHQLFEAQVERSPDAVAVILPANGADRAEPERLTYAQLNRRANQLAHYLRGLGFGSQAVAGICVERSPDMVVGLMGILKAGGAYLPLDPAYPLERLAFMLQDSQASMLLTQSNMLKSISGDLPLTSCKVVCLDSDWPRIEQASCLNPVSGVTPQDLAYVIYTSGSTGQPKGVLVEHHNVVNHNTAVLKAFELNPDDRVLQFSTINFDAAAEEIYPTLMAGATIVLRPGGLLPTATDFTRLIETQCVTVLDLPTAYWHEWVYDLSLLHVRLPSCVRLLVIGGEKASAERMALWQQVGGAGIRWLNSYGPTEGTIIASLYNSATDAFCLDGRELPIGRPIANARIYLLDQHLQPVPVGVPGELHIGGAAVARGYHNQPELTAERFIPDPFTCETKTSGRNARRLYKTGDLARYRPDGNIEYLGRIDHQVKIRGFRVELGEIEAVLAQHASVRQAVVITRDAASGAGKRLVAYVVSANSPHKGQDPQDLVTELRAYLKGKLPEYMLPSAFVLLDALPLTPSGKLDRRALPTPDVQAEHRDTYLPPRTPVERTLAGIWARVLGL
ncbi:MAG: amino acid adenylation domain-containing protein, partial [Chloroflexi bacterium]|nr:amino acid adenylation domain-containing protein [Chloroflexota bacterium]